MNKSVMNPPVEKGCQINYWKFPCTRPVSGANVLPKAQWLIKPKYTATSSQRGWQAVLSGIITDGSIWCQSGGCFSDMDRAVLVIANQKTGQDEWASQVEIEPWRIQINKWMHIVGVNFLWIVIKSGSFLSSSTAICELLERVQVTLLWSPRTSVFRCSGQWLDVMDTDLSRPTMS